MDNVIRSNARNLRRAFKKASRPTRIPARIVSAGSRLGYSLVEFTNGQQMEIFNPSTQNVADMKVFVHFDQNLGMFTVGGVGVGQFAGGDIPYNFPVHADQHTAGGSDQVWVAASQILPLLVVPDGNGAFVVQIFGGLVFAGSGFGKVENQTLDLSSYVPASGALQVLIQADADGAITTVTGSTVASKLLLTEDTIPSPSQANYPLCAVSLYAGQELLQRDVRPGKINDFWEIRFSGYSLSSATVAWENIGNGIIDLYAYFSPRAALMKARWVSAGGTTFDLPDFAESIYSVKVNGVEEDPALYSLSSDGSQVVFDSVVTSGFVVLADYLVRM